MDEDEEEEEEGDEEAGSGSEGERGPAYLRYEDWFLGSKTRRVYHKQSKAERQWWDLERKPDFVSRHLRYEFERVRWLGLRRSDACAEYGLTRAELEEAGIEVDNRSYFSKGREYLYPIADLIPLAREKHGSVAGLEAFTRRRRRADARRKAAEPARAAARNKELKVRAEWIVHPLAQEQGPCALLLCNGQRRRPSCPLPAAASSLS